MRSPRSVTCAPIGWPSRSLNCAMDLRAFVTCGFWPVIFGEVRDRAVDDLAVAGRLADAHVHDDLHEAGHLVHVGVAELLGEGLRDLGPVLLLQARLDFASLRSRIGHYRSLPDFLA